MRERQKLDTLDLIIMALREHENHIDALLKHLEILIDNMQTTIIEDKALVARVSRLEEKVENKI